MVGVGTLQCFVSHNGIVVRLYCLEGMACEVDCEYTGTVSGKYVKLCLEVIPDCLKVHVTS